MSKISKINEELKKMLETYDPTGTVFTLAEGLYGRYDGVEVQCVDESGEQIDYYNEESDSVNLFLIPDNKKKLMGISFNADSEGFYLEIVGGLLQEYNFEEDKEFFSEDDFPYYIEEAEYEDELKYNYEFEYDGEGEDENFLTVEKLFWEKVDKAVNQYLLK